MTVRSRQGASGVATWVGVVATAVAVLVATAAPVLAQFAGSASLANVSGAGIQGNAQSWAVAVSADGTIVAFASDADNLVALDTNGDTDVFVHDAVSGITERVSVNWQGEEAQGDNDCPAISADARFVAFRTRAWNMPRDGNNIGTPVWEVYLRDRQGPETIRVSLPLHGGLGTADSGCPAVSADGSRVAFASAADDLVSDDTNGVEDVFVYEVASGALSRVSLADDGSQANGGSRDPAISGDGSVIAFVSEASDITPQSSSLPSWARAQVYVRDLSAGTIEMASRPFTTPLPNPNAASCCPQISADGRIVLFHSTAADVFQAGFGNVPAFLFTRDRTEGQTERVETLSLGPSSCVWWADSRGCDAFTKGATLSADGRFIAFLSGSFQLLPENPPFHQDQIFLQDRLTRRLRRVSVDPTGYPIQAYPCGGSSSTLALSADGQVLGFVGLDTESLGLPDANGSGVRDVVRLEWTCAGESCRERSLCPSTPSTGCEPAKRSRLRIRRSPPLAGSRRDRFYWRWIGAGGGQVAPFVDPAAGAYQLCVYAGETMNAQVDAGIPAGPPWGPITNGWQRRERDGAVDRVILRSSPSRTMATVTSSSAALDVPYLPLDVPNGVTVQLHETTTSRCWEAEFPESAVLLNRRGVVTPSGGGTRGIVQAILD